MEYINALLFIGIIIIIISLASIATIKKRKK